MNRKNALESHRWAPGDAGAHPHARASAQPRGLTRKHSRLLTVAVALGWLIAPIGRSLAQTFTASSSPSRNWTSIASSADGNHLAALVAGETVVYITTNAGLTWTSNALPLGMIDGSSIVCSADGRVIAAAAGGSELSIDAGPIAISTNSGATWFNSGSPNKIWTALASSADGAHLVGATVSVRSFGGGIALSPDMGTTWLGSSAPSQTWLCIASSANGNNLVAANDFDSFLYTSSTGGLTWNPTTEAGQEWVSVASSADGTKLVAASDAGLTVDGPIFRSTNSGATWVQTSAPVTNWSSVACSADGTHLVAVGGGSVSFGWIFISTNSGATWAQADAPLAHWTSVASSADGSKLAASDFGGKIYTFQSPRATITPVLTIEAVISWTTPSRPFALQATSDLAAPAWADVSNTATVSANTLRTEVRVPLSGSSRFFRLISR